MFSWRPVNDSGLLGLVKNYSPQQRWLDVDMVYRYVTGV